MLVSNAKQQDRVLSSQSGVFWGGPDRPSRYLRNLLEERIHAVPSGGEILWVTYYFRDEGLARALLQAMNRGVQVRVAIEGNPRTATVNSGVLRLLVKDGGLGRCLRVIRHRLIDNRFFRTSRLHEKLYYFSHPRPSVLVGTFNPSGNVPEDSDVTIKIGDQDRGHNVLVELQDKILVDGLYAHALRLFQMTHGPWERFLPRSNHVLSSKKTRIIFFPRLQWNVFDELFEGLTVGSHLRIAVSHLNDARICKRLITLASRGVRIDVLAHDTKRRVPSWVEKKMLLNGVVFNRYIHSEDLPMHNKFMLFETPDSKVLTFGSMNLSVRSLHANHELLVISENTILYQTFLRRWNEMSEEVVA